MIDCQIVILAAGDGKRMGSDLPKVMHQIASKSMLEWVIENANAVTDDLILVISPRLEQYISNYQHIKSVIQEVPRGTADAVFTAINELSPLKPIAIIYADNPLISSEIISNLMTHLNNSNSAIVTLAFNSDNPAQYGRIITDADNKFIKIVEFKNASIKELEITLCNSGVTAFAAGKLQQYLPICLTTSKPPNQEFYLTELVEIASVNNDKVDYMCCNEHERVIGINTQEELKNATAYFKKSL